MKCPICLKSLVQSFHNDNFICNYHSVFVNELNNSSYRFSKDPYILYGNQKTNRTILYFKGEELISINYINISSNTLSEVPNIIDRLAKLKVFL